MGEQCDPEVRFNALQLLKQILQDQSLLSQAPNIARMLNLYQDKPRDIVLVMDCSSYMRKHKDTVVEYLCAVWSCDE